MIGAAHKAQQQTSNSRIAYSGLTDSSEAAVVREHSSDLPEHTP